jgi:cytochrome oxidase assembly protein ShyY1
MSAQGGFPSFDGATGWLNTQPLTLAEVQGRVVLVHRGCIS